MLERTHIPEAPWWVVQAVDKKRARLNCIQPPAAADADTARSSKPPVELPARVRNADYLRQPVPAGDVRARGLLSAGIGLPAVPSALDLPMTTDFTAGLTKNGLRTCAALGLSLLLATSSSAQEARDEVLDLKFADFFVQPVGPRGLTLTDALRAADGRRVRLVGYMVSQEQPAAGQFMLTARSVRMSEHADGEATDLPPATVQVMLDKGHRDRGRCTPTRLDRLGRAPRGGPRGRSLRSCLVGASAPRSEVHR